MTSEYLVRTGRMAFERASDRTSDGTSRRTSDRASDRAFIGVVVLLFVASAALVLVLTTGVRSGRVEGVACRLADGRWQLEG